MSGRSGASGNARAGYDSKGGGDSSAVHSGGPLSSLQNSQNSFRAANSMAKQYVGELISRVDFNPGAKSPRFI